MIVAHVFLAPYTLPVPFWMYLYGCAATLVLSSALLAYLATSSVSTHAHFRREVLARGPAWQLWRWTVSGLRVGAVAALAMTIATGVAGPGDPALNLGMTLFWVYFLLAFTYLTAVVGDLYDWINPWNTLAEVLQRFGVDVDRRTRRGIRAGRRTGRRWCSTSHSSGSSSLCCPVRSRSPRCSSPIPP